MKKNIIFILRIVSEIVFLFLFFFLSFTGKTQLWLLFMMVSFVSSIFLGRIFCGFICPIETLFRPLNWIYNKLGIKRLNVPKIFKHSFWRYLILVIFVASIIIFRVMKIKVNLFIVALISAMIITLFFKEVFWHRYLCPYGALFSILSRKSIFRMKITQSNCAGCGLCSNVCPTEAIEKNPSSKYEIEQRECILCMECIKKCPKSTINYTKK